MTQMRGDDDHLRASVFKGKMMISSISQRGSALIYILIAVALMAALTIAFMEPSSQQGQSQNTFKAVSDLQSQVSLISTSIQECALTYPGGDSTIDTSVSGTDIAANAPYPIKPNSTHLTSPDVDNTVKFLRCPGNPGNDPDHADIFSAAAGKFLPPPPALFEEWRYYNGKDGVFFWTRTSKTDAYLVTAMTKLDEEFAACESDVIDATGGVVQMETAVSTITCPSGSICFRYWVMRIGAGAPACP
jgi:hypothetical protein